MDAVVPVERKGESLLRIGLVFHDDLQIVAGGFELVERQVSRSICDTQGRVSIDQLVRPNNEKY